MAVFSGNGTNAAPSFTFSSDTDTGMYRAAADALAFATGATRAVTIDDAQRVHISTVFDNNLNTALQINGSDYVDSSFACLRGSPNAFGPRIEMAHSRSFNSVTSAVADNDYLGYLSWRGSDGTSLQKAGEIVTQVTGTPSAGIVPGRMVFSTADSSGNLNSQMTLTHDRYLRMASGTGGIQFNNDTAAANALDDYEEGTFTPKVRGLSANGSPTYSTRAGYYIKVGKIVHVEVYLAWTNLTGSGGSGLMRFDDMPFNFNASARPVSFNFSTLTPASLPNDIAWSWVEGASLNELGITYVTDTGSSASLNCLNNWNIRIMGSYIIW